MKRTLIAVAGMTMAVMGGVASAKCTFAWHHYGAKQAFKLIEQSIGSKVTEDYCQRYNKTHELVIVTDSYSDLNRTLAHVSVGLRKRDSNTFPAKRVTAYKFENGNFVIGKSHELAASLAIDTVMDVMSDLDSSVN